MSSFNEILSIDDSKAVHAFLDKCFEGSHYKLSHSLSAKDGISELNLNPNKYSLILLDWEMPEMNGPETYEMIKSYGITVPVIMLSSKNDLKYISQMLEKGAKEYILKPFTPEIILEKIQSVIGSIK